MANSYLSPNMSLVIPVPTVDPGPDWAFNLNASLTILDTHNHSSGSGVQITPSGININSDLPFNNTNNATMLRSVRFNSNASPIANAADIGCLYESGVDLYFNDGVGNQIRITQSGAVSGSSGTITGLPSGTASAAYQSGSGTFQFQQATSTAANMDMGSLVLRYPGSYPSPSGNCIILEVPSSIASQYSLILPSLPAQQNFMTLDSSGNISAPWNVDNSTLQISSNLVQVANGGITKPKLAALGQQISSSCGTSFSTSSTSGFVNVTNLQVFITTSGRPVFVGLISDGISSANAAFISTTGGPAAMAFVRVSTIVSTQSMNPNLLLPVGSLWFIDTPSAGTYDYVFTVKMISSGTFIMGNTKLIAYEL